MSPLLPGVPRLTEKTADENRPHAGNGEIAETNGSPPENGAAEKLQPDDHVSPSPNEAPFFIVGVGASAGGLEALEGFFHNMPTDTGMAFVVVQHLSPDFKSVMDELLARHTRIPIHRVTDGIQVEPNAIYLIPPKKELIISDGRLLLSDKDPDSGLALPIDVFFRSLAQDAGPHAVGVVLSGTGSDGSRGVRDIKAAEGFVLAQDLESAKFDGMPKSAIETGQVDLVLRPEHMAGALLTHIQHPLAEEMSDGAPTDPALLEGFDAVFQLLRKKYDIDFSYYKRTTVTRRVQRRLQMNQITDLEEYVERLREDPNELNSLYRDLLIGVTKFFRDTDAFTKLEKDVLPELMVKIRPEDELRLWIAGCATGEEAYSLAILIQERLEQMKKPLKVKIFATDVHQASLNVASVGIYSEAALSEVSHERLERHFTKVKNGYQVSQELRQMIVFAPHNIIKDAPFTKIDFISCRNLLIYFEPAAQKKALSLFHFALNTGGVMMLGPSESPGELSEEFTAIDDRWKVYRKRRDRRLPPDMRLPLSAGYMRPRGPLAVPANSSAPIPTDAPLLRVYDELLKDFAPPSLLINESRQLVQSFSGAAEFVKMRDGRLSTDVFELVLPELKVPLSTAVQQAGEHQRTVTFTGVRVQREQGDQQIKLTVKPMPDRHADETYFLVVFEPLAEPRVLVPENKDESEIDIDQASRDQVQALDAELRYTKESLQATVEEMETSNEELQATNEELVASNEELQSTNEELHSVNEELYTVNAEYQKKIDELTEMTADMDNLLRSTEVGVIFLDRDICIRKFTPKMAEVFHLLPHDIGRRIDSFTHNIERPELLDDIHRVLREKTAFETEVRGGEGVSYLLRILPYRGKIDVEGVVLTLIDISRLKRAERSLSVMSKVFLDGADPIIIEDLEGNITNANEEAVDFYGWTRDELIGSTIDLLNPDDEQLRARELRVRCLKRGGLRNIETRKVNRDGQLIPVLLTLSVLTDEQGEPVAFASSVKDITDRRRAEQTARDAVRKRDQFLAMLSHELRNPLTAALTGTYLLDMSQEGELPKPFKDAVKVIQAQTLQAARLLDDLLDVSRITQGKVQIRRETVDLSHLVGDAVQAMQPQINRYGHELNVEATSSPVYVQGDPTRLLQILENLLANAAKYTPPGGRVHFSLSTEDGEAVIRVHDNGKGIPADMLESIFEMFVQSEDTLDRTQGGMGIGLTLVRTLVDLHGGHVAAYSDGDDKGSEFVVRLPLTTPPADNANGESSFERTKTIEKHIVLVEDNAANRRMLQTLLELEGHRVSSAEDGRQGLEMIMHLRPDVAIVDIGLPQMNGYDVAKGVRNVLPEGSIYLIALTGYGREEDREAAHNAGFDTHLVKPPKPQELMKLVNALPQSSA